MGSLDAPWRAGSHLRRRIGTCLSFVFAWVLVFLAWIPRAAASDQVLEGALHGGRGSRSVLTGSYIDAVGSHNFYPAPTELVVDILRAASADPALRALRPGSGFALQAVELPGSRVVLGASGTPSMRTAISIELAEFAIRSGFAEHIIDAFAISVDQSRLYQPEVYGEHAEAIYERMRATHADLWERIQQRNPREPMSNVNRTRGRMFRGSLDAVLREVLGRVQSAVPCAEHAGFGLARLIAGPEGHLIGSLPGWVGDGANPHPLLVEGAQDSFAMRPCARCGHIHNSVKIQQGLPVNELLVGGRLTAGGTATENATHLLRRAPASVADGPPTLVRPAPNTRGDYLPQATRVVRPRG